MNTDKEIELRIKYADLINAATVVVICNERRTLTDKEIYLLEHALKEIAVAEIGP